MESTNRKGKKTTLKIGETFKEYTIVDKYKYLGYNTGFSTSNSTH